MKFLVILLPLLVTLFSSKPSVAATNPQPNLPIAKPNCIDQCGNVSIPFPFGTTRDCYLSPEFFVECRGSFDSPRALLWNFTIDIVNISLDGQLKIMQPIAHECYDRNQSKISYGYPILPLSKLGVPLSKFTVSKTANKLTVVGCDTSGFVEDVLFRKVGRNYSYRTGCYTMCSSEADLTEGSCDGFGCCQTSITKLVSRSKITLMTDRKYTDVWNFSSCGFAFIAEESAFNFSAANLTNLRKVKKLPMVIDWAVGNGNCDDVTSPTSACKSANSKCDTLDDSSDRYRCSCQKGYEGNPYLEDGCRDINECKFPSLHNCEKDSYCQNKPGSYKCVCPIGYNGDGTKNGTRCTRNEKLALKLGIGISLGILPFLLSGCLCWILQEHRLAKKRTKYLEKNGASLLRDGSEYMVKQFTESQLIKATNTFSNSMKIGGGGFSTIYKGIFPDGSIVAIKKYKDVDDKKEGGSVHPKKVKQLFNSILAIKKSKEVAIEKKSKEVDPKIKQFIKEVSVVFTINHTNAVKLLGCCLETRVPLLVYEFFSKDTLSDHIHNEKKAASLSWDMRFKIATETAGVLSHLHSRASPTIIHGDIKSANILLAGAEDISNLTVKVSEFGASRVAKVFHQTKVTTLVEEARGYLDPEFTRTEQLTEKSDVYSFGVVLAELLTGRKAVSDDRPEEERILANFIMKKEEEQLFQVLDNVVRKGKKELVMKVAGLAKRCLNVNGEERPSMQDVEKDLKGVEMVPEKENLYRSK